MHILTPLTIPRIQCRYLESQYCCCLGCPQYIGICLLICLLIIIIYKLFIN